MISIPKIKQLTLKLSGIGILLSTASCGLVGNFFLEASAPSELTKAEYIKLASCYAEKEPDIIDPFFKAETLTNTTEGEAWQKLFKGEASSGFKRTAALALSAGCTL